MSQRPEAVPSLWQSYQRMIVAVGDHAPAFRRSLGLFLLAGILEGLAFACFYPLIAALLK